MVIISLTLDEINIINIITAPAPAQEAATRIQLPNPFKLSGEIFAENPSITKATPRLAPELKPRTSGPAIGFLKIVCICNPLNDNATPTINAVIAFGNLNLMIMVSKLLSVLVIIALITSDAFMLTDPKKISRRKRPAIINIRIAKTFLFRVSHLRMLNVSFCCLVFKGSLLKKFSCKSIAHY